MLKRIAVALVIAALSVGCATVHGAHEAARIDATSIKSAEESYSRMMAVRSTPQRQRLALAVLVLNMEGVKSAYEVVGNPDLQSPSVGRIRDRVAGLSAEEIISLAARTSSVRIERAGR